MGLEALMMKIGVMLGAFLIGLIMIIPSKREKTYLLRGKVLTLKQIVELICEDGVIVASSEELVEVEYDHNPDAIPEVLELLREAELPARVRFRYPSVIMVAPPGS